MKLRPGACEGISPCHSLPPRFPFPRARELQPFLAKTQGPAT